MKEIFNFCSHNYWIKYTIIFLSMSFVVFSWFYFSDKTFVWFHDGWEQHYKAYILYGRWLREIFEGLFYDHVLVIPQWGWHLGEGNDIIDTLHYYVIGDPFALGSVFIPTRYMYKFFDCMILLRLYIAGLLFSKLCLETGHKNQIALIAGSMTYVFCSWAMMNVLRHPFFLNPMIWMPLLILGVEKVLSHKTSAVFILGVFFTCVSNIYFAWMIAVLTFLYIIIRLLCQNSYKIQDKAQFMGKFICYGILGIVMASIIVLPMAYFTLTDSRHTGLVIQRFLYPKVYYQYLLGYILTPIYGKYWLRIGVGAPSFFAVLYVLIKRKNKLLIVLLLITFIFIIFPLFGQILNGFSYISNRYSWAISLLFAYILVEAWDALSDISKKEKIIMIGIWSILFVAVLALKNGKNVIVVINFILGYLFIMSLFIKHSLVSNDIKQKCMMTITLLVIVVNGIGFYYNVPGGVNYSSEAVSASNIRNGFQHNEVLDLKKMDHGFFRYSGSHLTRNMGAIFNVSSTQYFWSFTNTAITSYRSFLGLNNGQLFKIEGYDGMVNLLANAGNTYYLSSAKDNTEKIPYGYELIAGTTQYGIYKNQYCLPYAYLLEKQINYRDWIQLNEIQKQAVLPGTAVLSDIVEGVKVDDLPAETYLLDTAMILGKNVNEFQNREYASKIKNGTITLNFKGMPQSEIIVLIKGLYYTQNTEHKINWLSQNNNDTDLKFLINNSTIAMLNYLGPENSWYQNKHDFTINLGYHENPINQVTIQLSKAGIYSFDSIQVGYNPIKKYIEKIPPLQKHGIQNLKIDGNTLKGQIYSSGNNLLFFSIPYSKGWEAFVDGHKTDILQDLAILLSR